MVKLSIKITPPIGAGLNVDHVSFEIDMLKIKYGKYKSDFEGIWSNQLKINSSGPIYTFVYT